MNKVFKLLPLLLVLGLAGCRPANNSSNNNGGDSGNSGDTTGGDTTQNANDKAAEEVIKTIANSLFGSSVKGTNYFEDSDDYGPYYYVGAYLSTSMTNQEAYEEAVAYVPTDYSLLETAAAGTYSDGTAYYGGTFENTAGTVDIEVTAYQDDDGPVIQFLAYDAEA